MFLTKSVFVSTVSTFGKPTVYNMFRYSKCSVYKPDFISITIIMRSTIRAISRIAVNLLGTSYRVTRWSVETETVTGPIGVVIF